MIHIYTGDGKGKTTAAFGLAMRMRGCGGKVMVVQFLKSKPSGEAKMAKEIGIEVICRAKPGGFIWDLNDIQRQQLSENTLKTFSLCASRAEGFEMLVLDEIICAINLGLIGEDTVLTFLANVPSGLEVVLTGRGATPGLMAVADYVSHIKCVKHPFEKGTHARRGIEF